MEPDTNLTENNMKNNMKNKEKMRRFFYNGKIDIIIEYFKFEEVYQTQYENSISTYYEKKIIGFEKKECVIKIVVDKSIEFEDDVYFFLISNTFGTGHEIRLDIQSVVDMQMLIKTLSEID